MLTDGERVRYGRYTATVADPTLPNRYSTVWIRLDDGRRYLVTKDALRGAQQRLFEN